MRCPSRRVGRPSGSRRQGWLPNILLPRRRRTRVNFRSRSEDLGVPGPRGRGRDFAACVTLMSPSRWFLQSPDYPMSPRLRKAFGSRIAPDTATSARRPNGKRSKWSGGNRAKKRTSAKNSQESEAQNANQQGPPPESLPATDKTQSDVGRQQGQAPKIDPKSGADAQDCSPQRSEARDIERASLQKSLQSGQTRDKTSKRRRGSH
jgi:hypothetical protein